MGADQQPRAIPIQDVADQGRLVPHRPIASGGDMDITPMIDITFLLLIFFLVATRLDTQGSVELPPAQHGTAVAARSAVILTITHGVSGGVQIYKGDGTEPANMLRTTDLAQQEEEIAAYVDAELNSDRPKQHVLIKAERDVQHQDVTRVTRAVGQVSDVSLYFAVYEIP